MFKKSIALFILFVLSGRTASADCTRAYQLNIMDSQVSIGVSATAWTGSIVVLGISSTEELNGNASKKALGALSATAAGATALAGTGIYMRSQRIIDSNNVLGLLRDASLGDGLVLRNIVQEINIGRRASTKDDISVLDLANMITQLNNDNAFCAPGTSLMKMAEIRSALVGMGQDL